MNTLTITFPTCTITVDHDAQYVETIFPDGKMVPARPQDNDEYRTNTERFGYGSDTWRECYEHEIAHTWVARLLGHPHSLILRNVADGNGRRWPAGGRDEEGYVTSLQRWLNTGEVDDLMHTVFESASRLHGMSRDELSRRTRSMMGRDS